MRTIPVRRAATSLRLRALDAADALTGRRDPLVPPRRMLGFVGDSDFVETGDEFLRLFVELGGLRPDMRVLDVGCGIGRMARPLVGFLGPQGSYEGFDVSPEGIAWCRRRYAGHPSFRFRHVDLYNRYYNPGGTGSAADLRFPYEDGAFDFAFLTSVVTHLMAVEARHSLAESRRVLAAGGRLLATFFILDEEAERGMREGRAAHVFRPIAPEVAVVDPDMPEAAVAYAAPWVRRTFAELGLSGLEVHAGSWSGREDGTSYQDIVIARA